MNNVRKCQNCGRPASPEDMPFCSRRCKDVDLARWFRGDYSIAVSEDDDIPDDEDGSGFDIH